MAFSACTGPLHTFGGDDKVSCSEVHSCLQICCSEYVFSINTSTQGKYSRALIGTLGTPGRRYKVSCSEVHTVAAFKFVQLQGDSGEARCANRLQHLPAGPLSSVQPDRPCNDLIQ